MNVLIVDPNRTVAKKIKGYLEGCTSNVQVDMASNYPIMKHRLNTKKYDYVIADIMASPDADAIMNELNNSNTPTILWTTTTPKELGTRIRHTSMCNIIKKPVIGTLEEMRQALSMVMA